MTETQKKVAEAGNVIVEHIGGDKLLPLLQLIFCVFKKEYILAMIRSHIDKDFGKS